MNKYIRRGRVVIGKVVTRVRRLTNQLTKPGDAELMLARIESSSGHAQDISGSVIAITGSSGGLGFAIARALAEKGARIILNGRSRERLDKAVSSLNSKGFIVHGICADVGTVEGSNKVVDEAFSVYGKVDIFINNAAVFGPVDKFAWEMTDKQWDDVFRNNLTGPFLCSKAFIARLLKSGVKGRIINVSSGASRSPHPKFAAYGISKLGLEGLTKYLAEELGSSGITVTAIMFGSMLTNMTKDALPWEVVQNLPPPEIAVPAFMYSATAPDRMVHGRVLAQWRMGDDGNVESILNGPLASVPRFDFGPLIYKGTEVSRDSGEISVFDRGENHYGPSPKALKAVAEALKKGNLYRYPDYNYEKLRKALSKELDLPCDCITFGNGSSELVERVLRLFVQIGDEVISEDPGWFIFDRFCAMMGIPNKKIRTVPHSDLKGRVSSSLKGILNSIGVRTRLIYLINPNNPTGIAIAAAEFKDFLKEVPADIPVVIDEAYIDFSENQETLKAHQIIAETDKMVIGLRTFSKFYGLAGFRVGYAVAAPKVIDLLNRLELPFNVSAISEIAAKAALEDTRHREKVYENFVRERKRIKEFCKETNLDFINGESNSVLVECPCDPVKFYNVFEGQGVFISRGLFVDDKYVIFPIGTPEQNTRNLQILNSLI